MILDSRIRTIGLITVLVLLWGLSWPIYKVALHYTPPVLFAGMRTFLGGLALALVIMPRWRKIQFRNNKRIYLICAFVNIFLFFGLQTVGLTYMPGGLFSVIVYFQPVIVGFLAWFYLGEMMTFPKMLGLVLGFLGVATISAHSVLLDVSSIGLILALLTSFSWAFGTIYLKKEANHLDALWLVALQSMLGGAVLICLGSTFESWSAIVWNVPYLSGLMFGSILGVPTAWVIYFKLVRSGEASRIAACTFLVPLISVSSSTFFLRESFNPLLFVGLVLIIMSIYLVNRRAGLPETLAAPRIPQVKAK